MDVPLNPIPVQAKSATASNVFFRQPSSDKSHVYLFRRTAVQTRMRPITVVAFEPISKYGAGLAATFQLVQIHALILHRPPKSFDKNIIHPSPLAVHGDAHTSVLECLREIQARKLAALVGVKGFGRPNLVKASSNAAIQKSESSVLESRQLSTRRQNQSITATR